MIRKQGGRAFIDIRQLKTDKNVSIPLVPIVEGILKKRNGNFPKTISDQRYNDYIKDVCRMAQINEKIEGKVATVTDLVYVKKWVFIQNGNLLLHTLEGVLLLQTFTVNYQLLLLKILQDTAQKQCY